MKKTLLVLVASTTLILLVVFLLFGRPVEEQEKALLIPLEAEIETNTIETYEGFATLLIKTNKEIALKPNSRLNLVKVSDTHFVLEINTITPGSSKLNFTVEDQDQNQKSFEVQIQREPGFSFMGKDYIPLWPNTTYEIDGDSLAAFVNKGRRLLTGYAPTDLINLKESYINLFLNSADFELRKEAAAKLNEMLEDLYAATSKRVVIVSAYRSFEEQASVYTSYVRNNGQDEADTYSARPGYSEHQLGTVVDFTNEDSGFQLTSDFDSTVAGKWLKENSHVYGYIQTYPQGSEQKTGYSYEAWHYRYVGAQNALELKEAGLVFTEWMQSKILN